jgi:hypothetical protein
MLFKSFSVGSKYEKLKEQKEELEESPTNLFRKENFAIAMSYFSVGFSGSFITTPMNIYLVNYLDAEPQMQNTISILLTLPVS